MKKVADFLFEVGMLKRTPRTGWQFLGSGSESVAEHVFRAAMIAFALSRMVEGVNGDRVLRMSLFHDMPEARTGDLNYMNQKYVRADEERAARDMAEGLSFGNEILELLHEFREQKTLESIVAKDADNLEMLLQLKEHLDVGNKNAAEWIPFTVNRLKTAEAKKIGEAILAGDSSSWWFDKSSDWWTRGGKV